MEHCLSSLCGKNDTEETEPVRLHTRDTQQSHNRAEVPSNVSQQRPQAAQNQNPEQRTARDTQRNTNLFPEHGYAPERQPQRVGQSNTGNPQHEAAQSNTGNPQPEAAQSNIGNPQEIEQQTETTQQKDKARLEEGSQGSSSDLRQSGSAPKRRTQMVGQESNPTEAQNNLQHTEPEAAQSHTESSQQLAGANTPEQKLELVIAEVKKMAFKYGTKKDDKDDSVDGDCGFLAERTIEIAKEIAKGKGYELKASLERENQAMLVEKGTIKGSSRQSNTGDDGEKMWFFHTHYWCKIEGIEYDPLFDKQGKPVMDLLDETKEHCECRIFKFKSGKAMVLENQHSEQKIKEDTVFKSYEEAIKFVEEKNPNYTSESE
ncbi:hypothetical protein [Nostoc sp.]|uniref:hypothetical protein n=1 Tax=Nostoc sp. TaxID=1180 RepID=UPI002FF4FA6B